MGQPEGRRLYRGQPGVDQDQPGQSRCRAGQGLFRSPQKPVAAGRADWSGTLLKLVMRRLTIAEVEKKMSKILGIACKAVLTAYPEIGADVDKESDYNLISARPRMAR